MNPSHLQRIHDATTGPLRHFERERERCLHYTNSLYGAAIRPREEALQSFADALAAVIRTTHRIQSVGVSSSHWITVHFRNLPGGTYFPGGEVSIYLPASRDAAHPYHRQKWVRGFPFITIRMPGDLNKTRTYQISPRETPEKIWARCARFFSIHAITTTATSQAA